jgi:hypothetical protein
MADIETQYRLAPKERAEDHGAANDGCAFDAGAGGESVPAQSVLRDPFNGARDDFQRAQQCHR